MSLRWMLQGKLHGIAATLISLYLLHAPSACAAERPAGCCAAPQSLVFSGGGEESAVRFQVVLCFALAGVMGTRMTDDRAEAEQLLHTNLDFIEHLLRQHTVCVGAETTPVFFELYFTGDFAGVRVIENSICGCPPQAMHTVPAAAADLATLSALLLSCAVCFCRATVEQRTVCAHIPVDGKILPCDCCGLPSGTLAMRHTRITPLSRRG
eukprot:6212097-Pleurochrysis_carterae.AAC.3